MKRATWDMTVYCSHPDHRKEEALYKIAAEWTGGDYSELKTYGFANDACVVDVYRAAAARVEKFEPCEGETLGSLCIYHLHSQTPDAKLERAFEVEALVQKKVAQNKRAKKGVK